MAILLKEYLEMDASPWQDEERDMICEYFATRSVICPLHSEPLLIELGHIYEGDLPLPDGYSQASQGLPHIIPWPCSLELPKSDDWLTNLGNLIFCPACNKELQQRLAEK